MNWQIAVLAIGWTTLETADVQAILDSAEPGDALLIDCIGMWLTRQLDDTGAWSDDEQAAAVAVAEVHARIDALVASTRASRAHVFMVTNEVGQGVVPATSSGRLFRDLMGIANARLAQASTEVTFMVAGRPLPLVSLPLAMTGMHT